MQRFLVGSQDTSHLKIIPVLGYSNKCVIWALTSRGGNRSGPARLAVFPQTLARTIEEDRRLRFLQRDIDGTENRPVHAREREQEAAAVNDRDVHGNADLLCVYAGELDDGLRFFQGEWHLRNPFHFFPSLSGEDACLGKGSRRELSENLQQFARRLNRQQAPLSASGSVSPGPDTVRTPIDDAIAQVGAPEARDSALAHVRDRVRAGGFGVLLIKANQRPQQQLVRVQPR